MKYFIITFGCQMNKSDSERIALILEDMNYRPASKVKEADLIVVNVCSVRQSAVDRIYGLIPKVKEIKGKNKKLKTILTGCVPKKDLRNLRNHFDYVLSIRTLNHWKTFLKKKECFYYPDPRNPRFFQEFKLKYLNIQPIYSNNFSALIPISSGCNSFCTFCIVPYTRGPEINRNHQEIIQEVKRAVKNGIKEIWLLGQNVNSYQSPINSSINFSKLLKMINDIKGNFWIRFTSSNIKDFSNELIKTIKNCSKVTKYINLPVQSGDNAILKKMNRPYTVKDYKETIKKIRKEMPNVFLSTDVIVGFPGETNQQFQNTAKLFKEIKFDMAYIAKYSPRPGTAAAKMKDTVSNREKDKREKILTKILKQTALQGNKKYINKAVEVLVERAEKGFLIGKTRSYRTVRFEGNKDLVGKFTKVRIIDALPWGLKGK